MKAMILAAGLGTRLRPFSSVRPKPLFPVLDQPLIFHIINQLRRHGVEEVMVNCYHLKEQIFDLLSDQPGIYLQQEEKILGTGGGLRKAMDFFGTEPMLIVNGDIYHSIDLSAVMTAHRQSGNTATLVLHDYPRFNNVSVSGNGLIRGFGERGGDSCLAFTGIHVIDPALLSIIPQDSVYNIIDCYRYWIAESATVFGLEEKGHYWSDIGTPEDYLDLHSSLLRESRFGAATPFLMGQDVEMADDVVLDDWAVIGSRATIGKGVSLKRVVVWDGAVVADGTDISDAIFY
ncbi:MAG: NTP transferase domain-containing protein [Desulfobulbaceae bacterium]|uniref:NTP transferase domain-containing protein n=1 Tax=Candidatus Desulfobia pelagia TaxID=2841692 RepID=A0A8J6NDY5_9BACT|nr:NTP transferase domain-containing protein [Candidatus Desulfobia pelagia]